VDLTAAAAAAAADAATVTTSGEYRCTGYRTSPVTTRAHCQWTDIAALAPELLGLSQYFSTDSTDSRTVYRYFWAYSFLHSFISPQNVIAKKQNRNRT